MTNEDNTIIQRIRNGDTKEFKLLVNRHGPALMVFAGRMVGQQEDAEDVVQNTFIAAYQHLKEYNPQRASLSTWLQHIAYHEALHHLRKHKQPGTIPLDMDDDAPEDLPETTTAEQLDKAIQMLRPEDQMLLHLYYFDERPLKEIAYIMNGGNNSLDREVSRLSSRLFRIRQRLRLILTRMNNEKR